MRASTSCGGCLALAFGAVAGPLSSQQIVYGSPDGGNVRIFWSHGVPSFGTYTHRWHFVSTLGAPIRVCFSFTRTTERGQEVEEVQATIRPGENRDPGYWTMTRTANDPPMSPGRDCSDGGGSGGARLPPRPAPAPTPPIGGAATPGNSPWNSPLSSR